MCGLRARLRRVWDYLSKADWLFFALAGFLNFTYLVQNVMAYGVLMCQEALDQGRNAFLSFLCQIHMFMIVICGFIALVLIAVNMRIGEFFHRNPAADHNMGIRRYKLCAWSWLYLGVCHIYGFKFLTRLADVTVWLSQEITGNIYMVPEGSEMDRCLARTTAKMDSVNETIRIYEWERVYEYFEGYSIMMAAYELLHLVILSLMISYARKRSIRTSATRPTPPIVQITVSQM